MSIVDWPDENEPTPINQPKVNQAELATTRRLNQLQERLERADKIIRVMMKRIERLELESTPRDQRAEEPHNPLTESVLGVTTSPSPNSFSDSVTSVVTPTPTNHSSSEEKLDVLITLMSSLVDSGGFPRGGIVNVPQENSLSSGSNAKTPNKGKISGNRVLSVLPSNYVLTANDRAMADNYWKKKGRLDLSCDEEFEKFCNYWWGVGTKKKSWGHVWRTWYSNAVGFNKPDTNRSHGEDHNDILDA